MSLDTDNFANRLKLFFENEGISPTQFADACEISRPTLSQILNGRNKKVSNLLVSQIHNGFPNLNILWLMFGEGDMYEAAPDNGESADMEGFNKDVTDLMDMPMFAPDGELGSVSFDKASRRTPNKSKGPEVVTRKISHITVYYDDQTFETFYPKK